MDALAEAVAHPVRPATQLARKEGKENKRKAKPPVDRQVWRAARRFTTALVVAAFPFLFLWDGSVHFPVSPVLPGVVVLALCIVALPIPLASLFTRRAHKRDLDPDRRAARATRLDQWAGLALVAAVLWFIGWLALGS